SRPSSPSTSRRRPCGGTPDARCARCQSVRLGAVRRVLARRLQTATATPAYRARRSASIAAARRHAGSTFGPEHLPPLATTPRARRRSSVGRRANRRDCGFRNRQHETPFHRMAIFLPAYTDAPNASTIPRARFPVVSPWLRGCSVRGRARTYGHVVIVNYKILCAQLHFVDQCVDGTR